MGTNKEKFEHLKSFNLPLNQFAVTGSGPLGIRNLREINDVDILVTPELWKILAKKFIVVKEDNEKKIVFPGDVISAYSNESFHEEAPGPTLSERISQAEIIDGLPFESLVHVLHFKKNSGREKDFKDIQLIEGWIKAKR